MFPLERNKEKEERREKEVDGVCEERERSPAGECYRRRWGWNAEVPAATGVVLTAWRTLREASRRPCCGLSWQMGECEP